MLKAIYKKHILQFKQASGTSRGVMTEKETWFIILEENGKTIFDVLWFGTKEAVFDVDIQKLFSVDYDDGFGGQEIPSELIVVGEDWWLERHEYDGSEWWEFKTMPVKPTAIKQGANLLQRWQ